MAKFIKVVDVATGHEFPLRAANTLAVLEVRDGARVRVHPHVIDKMVRVGQEFDAKTLPTEEARPMRRTA